MIWCNQSCTALLLHSCWRRQGCWRPSGEWAGTGHSFWLHKLLLAVRLPRSWWALGPTKPGALLITVKADYINWSVKVTPHSLKAQTPLSCPIPCSWWALGPTKSGVLLITMKVDYMYWSVKSAPHYSKAHAPTSCSNPLLLMGPWTHKVWCVANRNEDRLHVLIRQVSTPLFQGTCSYVLL